MDFALNDEQQMLQDSARRFFAERHPLSRARQALPWSDEAQHGLWSDMADMGWLALLVPEAHDGLGLGLCEAFLVGEAAGRRFLQRSCFRPCRWLARSRQSGGLTARRGR